MKVAVNLEKTEVADFYRKMLLIRRFEEASARLYMQRLIGGFLHLYIGEEAVAVGAISLLEPQDYIITHYRDHGHALARGLDPKACMAELCGRSTGTSGGKGGFHAPVRRKPELHGRPRHRWRPDAYRRRNWVGDTDAGEERRRHDLLRRRRGERGRVPPSR